jgi:two-component system LytT family response regulator
MISCIIIDDEKRAIETFRRIVSRYLSDRLEVVAEAASVKEGVRAILEFRPDMVFLDIEMPGENGFKLFDYFDEMRFEVVFLTAFKSYAIDAIKYAAFDYLLKPLDPAELQEVAGKYEKKSKGLQSKDRVHALMANLQAGSSIQGKVALPTPGGFRMENINNIVYCEADENYSNIYTSNGETVLVSRTLKMVEELLPSDFFFRIHKSYLVNLNYVKEYNRSEGHKILLENGVELEVASRRHDELLKTLTKNRL